MVTCFALWCTYCAPILAGMCPTSVRRLFSARMGSNILLHGSVPVLSSYIIGRSTGATESQVFTAVVYVCVRLLLSA